MRCASSCNYAPPWLELSRAFAAQGKDDRARAESRPPASCYPAIMHPEIKRVGQSGQISIGRELAGKLLRLEQLEGGRLLLTPVVDVPESQLLGAT